MKEVRDATARILDMKTSLADLVDASLTLTFDRAPLQGGGRNSVTISKADQPAIALTNANNGAFYVGSMYHHDDVTLEIAGYLPASGDDPGAFEFMHARLTYPPDIVQRDYYLAAPNDGSHSFNVWRVDLELKLTTPLRYAVADAITATLTSSMHSNVVDDVTLTETGPATNVFVDNKANG